jgi:hypothetical protein
MRYLTGRDTPLQTGAYTSLPWHVQPDRYPVAALANSVLIEWVNNNNNFCKRGHAAPSHALSLQPCEGGAAQQFTFEKDGSIRHAGSASQCLDVTNCDKVDGTAVSVYRCHPNGTTECGYKNQQFEAAGATLINLNSGSCLSASGTGAGASVAIRSCKAGEVSLRAPLCCVCPPCQIRCT